MRLLLLRHGMTMANESRLYCGFSDPGLSEKGRSELLRLKERIDYPDTCGMIRITSGMRRTDETLRLLFDAEPDARVEDLREMNFGRFELHSYDQLRSDADYQAWIMDESGGACTPGGESRRGFRKRVISAAEGIDRDALIVCHGGVISALMAHWFPGEGLNMYQWQPGFGQGYIVELADDGARWRKIEENT